ncbi:hypothetical protein [Methylobacterium organophilum]|uniref:Uncharacterized protein n=1 Tax=Methylobacterium organophilum TaxID=410 RepID=A0ABQ4T566_METOR|nr:hypothetical protein [Methylobacterium organophilum]GJE25787.1 hypothetical protein LKMONMHP_0627 [Methylobacterium organophilum]
MDEKSRRTALAERVSQEMSLAEREGFSTATLWLNRADSDLICAALAQAAAHEDHADTARLDFLERCNAALAARYGTGSGWTLTIDHGGDRLALRAAPADRLGSGVARGPLPSCRDAIDEKRREYERALGRRRPGASGPR